jgi:hypothetical protein
LHKKALHQIGGVCSRHYINAYQRLFEKPKRNGPLGRPNCGWEYNIKMELKEMVFDGVQ